MHSVKRPRIGGNTDDAAVDMQGLHTGNQSRQLSATGKKAELKEEELQPDAPDWYLRKLHQFIEGEEKRLKIIYSSK